MYLAMKCTIVLTLSKFSSYLWTVKSAEFLRRSTFLSSSNSPAADRHHFWVWRKRKTRVTICEKGHHHMTVAARLRKPYKRQCHLTSTVADEEDESFGTLLWTYLSDLNFHFYSQQYLTALYFLSEVKWLLMLKLSRKVNF